MKQPAKTIFVLVCIPALTGCTLFHRGSKSKEPKEITMIAADTDAVFRQHWIEKRSADLVAKGLTPAAAAAQADSEFGESYQYVSPAKK